MFDVSIVFLCPMASWLTQRMAEFFYFKVDLDYLNYENKFSYLWDIIYNIYVWFLIIIADRQKYWSIYCGHQRLHSNTSKIYGIAGVDRKGCMQNSHQQGTRGALIISSHWQRPTLMLNRAVDSIFYL